ncbi:MAG: bifunctional 4-hydroxy-2-oxoglutarate aldolase/2-dehydro-3-deoxy-phosphogluconate aldolase [Thermodesulfobacteriota bacterium]
MEKEQVKSLILSEKLIPVVRVARAEEAVAVAKALVEGGSHIIEITMTVQGALEAMRDLKGNLPPEVVLGAGTVTLSSTARAAVEAGARFLVSPCLSLDVVETASFMGVLVISGAMTPTEILSAWRAGASLVKVFPVGPLGGPSYIRAIKGPFPGIPLVPTGGVSPSNARDYILAGASAVGMGGELVDRESLARKDWGKISQRTKEVMSQLRSL